MPEPMTADEETQQESAGAAQDTADLQAKVERLTNENERLQGLLDQLKAEIAQLKEKLPAVESPAKDLPAGLPTKP
jgi:predicted RNase H-like nuclease (RuvC/YqgF family)